jgi:hypothetical protein
MFCVSVVSIARDTDELWPWRLIFTPALEKPARYNSICVSKGRIVIYCASCIFYVPMNVIKLGSVQTQFAFLYVMFEE